MYVRVNGILFSLVNEVLLLGPYTPSTVPPPLQPPPPRRRWVAGGVTLATILKIYTDLLRP